MKMGDIVFHKNLKFGGGIKDDKRNRPCIFLFSEDRNDGQYIYSIPLTSQTKTFNKRPFDYTLVPEPIYNNKKISFAKLNFVVISKLSNVILSDISLSECTMNIILEKIEKSSTSELSKEEFIHFKQLLLYYQLFEKIETKQHKDCKLKILN